jgi:DNA-binding response OmpR family regulator
MAAGRDFGQWRGQTLSAVCGEGAHTVTLDDDPIVGRLVEEILGFKTHLFGRVEDLRASFDALSPVGVFVDVHLTGGECGLDIVPQIKAKWPMAPVLVITADHGDALVGQALAAGADDFVLKPLKPGELVARLVARRTEIELRSQQTILRFGDVTLDLRQKLLGGPLGRYFQSGREVEILAYLIRANGAVVDKASLKRRVWGDIAVSDNAFDRKLFEVRKALRTVTSNVEIRAFYGQGIAVRMRDDGEATEALPRAVARVGTDSRNDEAWLRF